MKKIILALAFSALTSSSAYSEEAESQLMEAPNEYIMNNLMQCQEYAIEDETTKSDLVKYLLTCINNVLEESDYKPITAIPQEE